MKRLLLLFILMCTGCASENLPPVSPRVPECPAVVKSTCSDKVMLVDEETLKKGVSCSEDSKLVFPSYFQQGKILIMCQCK
jgi:hypothetical protein